VEINITEFYNNENPHNFSGSVSTHGENVALDTWNAAKDGPLLLDTMEKLQAMRDWAKSSGGWDSDEIAAWNNLELNALFIQLVSAEMEEETQDGHWESGLIFRGDDEQVYIYLGE